MSRAYFAAHAAALLTLMSALACGGDAGDAPGGGGGGSGAPGDVATDVAALCATACDNASSGLCNNDNADCTTDCRESFEKMPRACAREVRDVLACYTKQTVVCDGEQAPSFPTCNPSVQALVLCVQKNPPAQAPTEEDPTYGGRCLPSSSTPEHSAERCGELPETPLLYECTGGAPREGCVDDPAGGGDLYCCPEL